MVLPCVHILVFLITEVMGELLKSIKCSRQQPLAFTRLRQTLTLTYYVSIWLAVLQLVENNKNHLLF